MTVPKPHKAELLKGDLKPTPVCLIPKSICFLFYQTVLDTTIVQKKKKKKGTLHGFYVNAHSASKTVQRNCFYSP